MTPSEPKLIYILGTGHNGSTLLSILLDDLQDVTAFSEIQRIPEMSARLSPEHRGGSAKWAEIEADFIALTGKSFREAEADLVVPSRPAAFLAWLPRIGAFRKASDALYQVLARHGATPWICDASKMPTRALALKLIYGRRVRIVCLDRDVRSVLKSYARLGAAPSEMSRRIVGCFVGGRLLKLLDWSTVIMKYEDLAKDPEQCVKALGVRWKFDADRKKDTPLRLFAGGNPMRIEFSKVDPALAEARTAWPEGTPAILRRINRWSGYGEAAEPAAS